MLKTSEQNGSCNQELLCSSEKYVGDFRFATTHNSAFRMRNFLCFTSNYRIIHTVAATGGGGDQLHGMLEQGISEILAYLVLFSLDNLGFRGGDLFNRRRSS